MDISILKIRQLLPLMAAVLILVTFTTAGASKPTKTDPRNTKFTIYRTTKRGGYLSKTFQTNGDECDTLPKGWNEIFQRWAVSIVGDNCVSFYLSSSCEGPHTDISNQKTSFKEKLKRIGSVNSFRKCSSNSLDNDGTPAPVRRVKQITFSLGGHREQPEPKLVTFYTDKRFRGRKYTSELKVSCENLPVNFRKEVSSIQTPTNCVRLYVDLNCQGRSIQIQTFDRYKDDLSWLDFNDRVHSFGPCEAFQQHGLDLHNHFRALHNTPPLEMEESLNQAAQLMAEYLVTQPALPRPIGFISSELFYATNNGSHDKNKLVDEAVNSWYKEGEQYDPTNPVNSRFTQLIWRNTRKFGMGTARVGNRAVVVTNYFPRGNFAGQFQTNVLPLISRGSG